MAFQITDERAIAGSLPHVTVFAWEDRLENASTAKETTERILEWLQRLLIFLNRNLLAGSQTPQGSLIRGIDPLQEPQVTEIASFLEMRFIRSTLQL